MYVRDNPFISRFTTLLTANGNLATWTLDHREPQYPRNLINSQVLPNLGDWMIGFSPPCRTRRPFRKKIRAFIRAASCLEFGRKKSGVLIKQGNHVQHCSPSMPLKLTCTYEGNSGSIYRCAPSNAACLRSFINRRGRSGDTIGKTIVRSPLKTNDSK